jgi:hypothetical protein
MLFLTSYFDESGDVTKNLNSYQQNFTGIAGFVAPADVWESLQRDWLEVVNRPEFSLKEYFHMKEFAHQLPKGQFSGWDQNRKDDLYKALVAVIVKHEVVPIGCLVSTEGYRSLTDYQRELFRSPYVTCFQDVVFSSSLEALDFEPEKISYVFAHQQTHGTLPPQAGTKIQNWGSSEKLFFAMKASKQIGHRLGAYSVSTPQESIPLQVADILAWELMKEFETVTNCPERDMRRSLEELLKAGGERPFVRFLDRIGLLRLARDSGFPDQTGTNEVDDCNLDQLAVRFAAQALLYQRRRIKPDRLYQPAWQKAAMEKKWGANDGEAKLPSGLEAGSDSI